MKPQHLVVLGILGLIGAMFLIELFVGDDLTKAVATAWRDFALENGLEFQPGEGSPDYGRITGELHGRSFQMWTFEATDLSVPGADTRTRMTLRPSGMPDGFAIYRRENGLIGRKMESWSIGLASERGAEIAPTVTVEDALFDEAWVVRGFDAETVRQWLASSQRRQAIVGFLAEASLDSWTDGIRWEGRSPTTRPEIDEIVALLEAHAQRIEHP